MQIQCPSCRSTAQIPSNKEGAKVRCAECERVYVARAPGSSSKDIDPTKYVLIGGMILAIAGVFFYSQQGDKEPMAAAPVVEKVDVVDEPVDLDGWNSAPVMAARDLTEHILGGAENKLIVRIDGEAVRDHRLARVSLTGTEDDKLGQLIEDERELLPEDAAAWPDLGRNEQSAYLATVVRELVSGSAAERMKAWVPYDGWLEKQDDKFATVRLKLSSSTDPTLPDQHAEWRFVERDGIYRAFYWARWVSPEELHEARLKAKPTIERKVLSDGSHVVESTVRPIPHMESTPPELVTRIDELVTQLIDIDSRPGPRTEAANAIVEIGKPAIPALLTILAEIPLETTEQAMQLNLVHMRLKEITGYTTSFKPHEVLGTTQERIDSGLKQWFGWYDRKFKRFEVQPETDEEPLLDE